jgi:hypothetical protein
MPLNEIREISRVKSGYDSLRTEIKQLKGANLDSAEYDSHFAELKAEAGELADRELELLERLKTDESLPSPEVREAIGYTQNLLSDSKAGFSEAGDLGNLEEILQGNEENLKSLVNEYLFPQLESLDTGLMPDLSLNGKAELQDYYTKGGLEALSEGMDMATVREDIGRKATSLTMEMLSSYGNSYSKIQLLEDGTVKVTPPAGEKKGKKFFETNAYKEKTFYGKVGGRADL